MSDKRAQYMDRKRNEIKGKNIRTRRKEKKKNIVTMFMYGAKKEGEEK